jgi:bacterioferritin-associated ferredoxin
MIVCICNALNECKIRQAIAEGARNPAAIYKAHGCKPQCGKCGPDMKTMISDHFRRSSAPPTGPAPKNAPRA